MNIYQMDKNFILFRCLHNGPISPSNIGSLPGEQFDRNNKFFTRLIDAYGSCAMLVWDDDYVVAHARFYPQIIYDKFKFCCHDPNYAITREIAEIELPPLTSPAERTLRITCFFIYMDFRGQGLSHKLIDAIIKWAQDNSWRSIRCYAYQENHWLSSEMCKPMLSTYRKHGFKKIENGTLPEVKDFLQQMKNGELGAEKSKHLKNSVATGTYQNLWIFMKWN